MNENWNPSRPGDGGLSAWTNPRLMMHYLPADTSPDGPFIAACGFRWGSQQREGSAAALPTCPRCLAAVGSASIADESFSRAQKAITSNDPQTAQTAMACVEYGMTLGMDLYRLQVDTYAEARAQQFYPTMTRPSDLYHQRLTNDGPGTRLRVA